MAWSLLNLLKGNHLSLGLEAKESLHWQNLPRAWGGPAGDAYFRTTADDFVVVEDLKLQFSGDGDHLCLQISKRNQNTLWIAARLARNFNVSDEHVGYCGLKDRRAVTTQWFSVRSPSSSANLPPTKLFLPECDVLQTVRHRHKLRPGMHQSNTFKIRLKDFTGDIKAADQVLANIAATGVPNYFGEQRFGRNGGNLAAAERILTRGGFRGRGGRKRGLYLSAARALLFNKVLAARVAEGTWTRAIAGESVPGGPLWGRGCGAVSEELRLLEKKILAPYKIWRDGLEHCGLEQERRTLILRPALMEWHWQRHNLLIVLTLPPGSYATSVVREVVATNEAGR